MSLVILQRNRIDPTRTLTLRNRYVRAMNRRFNALKSDIRVSIKDRDGFGIRSGPFRIFTPAPQGAFAFPTDEAKVRAFMEWLHDQVDAGVLEIISRDGRRITAHSHWQDDYVRQGYVKGVNDARNRLQRAGVALDVVPDAVAFTGVFDAPIHADRLELLFTRNFEELKGITEVMSQQIARELTDGLVQGEGIDSIVRRLVERVDGIGKRRGELLARTEIIRSYSESTLNEYERLGQQNVTAMVELSTALDGRVCEQCLGLEGHVYTIENARGIIPLHPA